MSWWDDLKREIANLWEVITTGEPLPEEETPEEEEEIEEPGGFFGPPEEPPGPGIFGGEEEPEEEPEERREGFFAYDGEGPYPFEWGPAEERFWDRQTSGHFFDNDDHYDRAQELFYQGYMAGDDEISHEDRIQAREDFLDWTYFDDIDWDAFADYYAET